MKNKLLIIGLIFISIGANAQTSNSRFGITGGFGFQQYNGDVGSNFYVFDRCMYGVGAVSATYYLNDAWDVGFFGTLGDYSYCQPQEHADETVAIELRCPGCVGRVGMGDFKSRMTSGGFLLKYKFANGFILPEKSRLKPYIYGGMAFNHIVDRMNAKCVNPGNYKSVNAGIGVKYYVAPKVNIGLNIAIGSFTSDKVDLLVRNGKDLYLQNTFFVGFDLF